MQNSTGQTGLDLSRTAWTIKSLLFSQHVVFHKKLNCKKNLSCFHHQIGIDYYKKCFAHQGVRLHPHPGPGHIWLPTRLCCPWVLEKTPHGTRCQNIYLIFTYGHIFMCLNQRNGNEIPSGFKRYKTSAYPSGFELKASRPPGCNGGVNNNNQ